ncbi:MAG TPA: GNAT family N-acetyltransferase [Tepidisphaeraceae bacterium]|jgi:predicted acetyltransferase
MQFHRLDHAIDAELELIRPSARYIDDMVSACQHPQSSTDEGAAWTRLQLNRFVDQYPDGIEPGDVLTGRAAGYYLWMRLRPEYRPVVPIAGTLALRLGDSEQISQYIGHIGYGVFPPARGHHYAERACRLIAPLAKMHGHDYLWITANPDNLPSRRTAERLGAELINIVDIPIDNPLYARGERQKCRYRWII